MITLAKKIDIILGLPKEACGDKEQTIRNTIDFYIDTGKYPLLEKVVKGETKFQEEYKLFIERHTGWKSLLIPFRLKEEKRVAEENKELVNPYNLTSGFVNLITPVTLGASGIIASYVIGAIVTTTLSVLTGDNLFPYLLDAASGASKFVFLACAGTGLLSKVITVESRRGLEKEIKMLDESIDKIYHNNQGGK